MAEVTNSLMNQSDGVCVASPKEFHRGEEECRSSTTDVQGTVALIGWMLIMLTVGRNGGIEGEDSSGIPGSPQDFRKI